MRPKGPPTIYTLLIVTLMHLVSITVDDAVALNGPPQTDYIVYFLPYDIFMTFIWLSNKLLPENNIE